MGGARSGGVVLVRGKEKGRQIKIIEKLKHPPQKCLLPRTVTVWGRKGVIYHGVTASCNVGGYIKT